MQAGLVCSNLSKTFNKELLFEKLDAVLPARSATAITGPNGSGKSTLLKIIAGLQLPSAGSISLTIDNTPVAVEQHYHSLSFAAPYVDLIEEYSLPEMLDFYFSLKPLQAGISLQQLPELLLLEKTRHKEIRSFSSGMKQRVKLGLAFFSAVPLMILDEPTSHLDEQGKAWYTQHLKTLLGSKTIIIASNQEEEIGLCTQRIHIPDYR